MTYTYNGEEYSLAELITKGFVTALRCYYRAEDHSPVYYADIDKTQGWRITATQAEIASAIFKLPIEVVR